MREYPDFLSKFFRLTVPKNLVEESFTVALISVTERVWIRGGGGRNQYIPSKIFCITVTEKFPYGNPLLHYFRVPKKFGEEGGEYQDLPSKIFRLTVPKDSVGESLDVALFSVTEKVWIRGRRGTFKIIRRKFFVSQCRNFVGEPFTVALISSSEKVWIGGGRSIKDFRRNIVVSYCRNFP